MVEPQQIISSIMADIRHTNRLITETSPYLLQHAHNPVDWFGWNVETLGLAQREDKPILLSIGYSACHWCHVMEHESFEDDDVAKLMNDLFVCIKVDREERPDLDKIYQTAHQILIQRPGGWPLNMFLKPDDRMPFFGGTYFPKEPRYGMPAFSDVLNRVAKFYRENRDSLDQQSESLRDIFKRIQPSGTTDTAQITPHVLNQAYAELKQQYDPRNGGFGAAPKFPHPPSIERCLRYWAQSVISDDADSQALSMAAHTLHAMASAGLYDQLGGGFCRYSVDEAWMIPHFEKMLYDNAQLLNLYADATIATGDQFFSRIASATADWVMREMQSPEGGYYSTLDADSEGEEGKFYVWTADEIRDLLGDEEWSAVQRRYGLNGSGNFEGRWHLNVRADTASVAKDMSIPESQVVATLENAHQKLLQAREKRIRPGRDEKILTSWNGLMIKGMARAGRLLAHPELIKSAEAALSFVRDQLWKDGRLLATSKDGRAHLNAYLDDYVFLIDGLLELLQARWSMDELEFTQTLADTVLKHFQNDSGGFYFTADDHEELVYRPMPTHDDAIPSGNSVAAHVLLRLGHLLGETTYLEAAERTIKALHSSISQSPSGHGTLLLAVEEYLFPTETIVLRGSGDDMRLWIERCNQFYAPRRFAVAIPEDVSDLPGMLAERAPKSTVTAYVCAGHSCLAPITKFAAFDKQLKKSEVTRSD